MIIKEGKKEKNFILIELKTRTQTICEKTKELLAHLYICEPHNVFCQLAFSTCFQNSYSDFHWEILLNHPLQSVLLQLQSLFHCYSAWSLYMWERGLVVVHAQTVSCSLTPHLLFFMFAWKIVRMKVCVDCSTMPNSVFLSDAMLFMSPKGPVWQWEMWSTCISCCSFVCRAILIVKDKRSTSISLLLFCL